MLGLVGPTLVEAGSSDDATWTAIPGKSEALPWVLGLDPAEEFKCGDLGCKSEAWTDSPGIKCSSLRLPSPMPGSACEEDWAVFEELIDGPLVCRPVSAGLPMIASWLLLFVPFVRFFLPAGLLADVFSMKPDLVGWGVVPSKISLLLLLWEVSDGSSETPSGGDCAGVCVSWLYPSLVNFRAAFTKRDIEHQAST